MELLQDLLSKKTLKSDLFPISKRRSSATVGIGAQLICYVENVWEEFVHWGSVSWSYKVCVVVMRLSVDLMYTAISGALSTFTFHAGCWNGAVFPAEVTSSIPEAILIRRVLAVTSKTRFFVFSSIEICSVDAAYFCCVIVVVLEQAAVSWTFLSALSIARAICLAWSKFNFFPPINVCGYGRPRHLQSTSPLTYPGE